MLTITPTCQLYIPNDRHDIVTGHVKEKINYLANHPSVIGTVIGLPDFGDDREGLNGLYFQTHRTVFPMGPGMDVGCGFRLLHLKPDDLDIKRIENDVRKFGETITSLTSGIRMSACDVKKMTHDPVAWLKEKEIKKPIKRSFSPFDEERPSFIQHKEVANSFARLAKGNHFIEIRKIDTIYDEQTAKQLKIEPNDFLIHIHSGSGYFVERSFRQHMNRFANKTAVTNGYEVFEDIATEKAKDYLADVERSLRISYINRCVLTDLLEKWLQKEMTVLFDVSHDTIEQENECIHHFKAVQRFSLYRNHDIAIIPTTLSGSSHLVKKRSDFRLVNHGVGDGNTGKAVDASHVVTNFKQPVTRRFYDAASVFQLCEKLNWFTPILSMNPWICIKNTNPW